jgi:hypothetical protein
MDFLLLVSISSTLPHYSRAKETFDHTSNPIIACFNCHAISRDVTGSLYSSLLTGTLTFSYILPWKRYLIMSFIYDSGMQASSYR